MKSGKPARSAGILAAAFVLVTACGSAAPPPPLDADIVSVGVKLYPGLSPENSHLPVGFEAQARSKILKHAGVRKSAPTRVWANNWETTLSNGKVHLVMGMISDSDLRAGRFRLARSYLRTDIGLLTLADAEPVHRVADLAGKTICTVEGTTADETMKVLQSSARLHLTSVSTPETCVEKVRKKEAFAYSTDRIILMGFTTQSENVDEETGKSRFRVPDLPLGRQQHISIALRKDHGEACRRLVSAIDTYVRSNDWLTDLRSQLIDEYLRLAPGNPHMTDEQIREKFEPKVIDTDRCADGDALTAPA
ncbi:transporter substrate-binding domain-containing protein [Nonomuraea mesophila]|uniref:Transporter substrate-binding domain-containing protein n=1 Tax=Nonomuraea mesophila TaxID=2530382 RepID=A0A4R5EZU8_9ACTN|nr:transporter substrate-binding domain-containing protein [Nonomuraea mesophila]TDE40589.1 transporter substrate-binding domain-containing protein [Nonomuraea mesophila]